MNEGQLIAAPPAAEFECVDDFMPGVEFEANPEYAALIVGMSEEDIELSKALVMTNWKAARAGALVFPNLSAANQRQRAGRLMKNPAVKELYDYFRRIAQADTRPITQDEVVSKMNAMWRNGDVKDSKAYMELTKTVIEFNGITPKAAKADGNSDIEHALAKAQLVISGKGQSHQTQPGVVH